MTIHKAEQVIARPQYLGGGQWTIRNLTDITVVMGKNGSGKSVLLRSWRDQLPDSSHYVVPERTGEMDFQPHYLQQEFDGVKRMGISMRNFVEEYRRRILSRVQTYFMIRGNARTKGTPAGDPAELERLLGTLLPDFIVELVVNTPPYNLKRVATGEVIQRVDQLSSGEAQLLTIGLDILTIASIWEIEGRRERVMLLDEPDAHIHPDLQARFAEFVIRLVDRFSLQFVVATHSTALMSALGQFGGTKTSIVYADRLTHSYTTKPFDAATKELASCLGGHVLMGPLFGAPLLLVEGDDDYRIWAQAPRHHVVKLAVLPCNGDEIRSYQRVLENMLSSLCEPQAKPLGFALRDGDKKLPIPSRSNPQQYVRFIKLACHEAENLYLTEQVLATLGHTWETAQQAIKAYAPKCGRKRVLLERCDTWNRQSEDIKAVVTEIAEALDPKGVHWTIRVGTTLGAHRPVGEIATFLGNGVVSSLWG